MKDRLISEHRFVEDLYGCLNGCDFELEDVLNVLKGVESVDAVPIVRCKDCVHGKESNRLIDGGYECELIKGCAMSGSWYCADGERKDDEDYVRLD